MCSVTTFREASTDPLDPPDLLDSPDLLDPPDPLDPRFPEGLDD